MADLSETQHAPNPELAKTVRIDPDATMTPAAGAEDPMRKTVVMNRPPEIDAIAWIVSDRGATKGASHQVTGARATVGADADCDVVIVDPHASDRHLSIRFDEGRFTLTDLDSTNGTKVNGESVLRTELSDGDRIAIGSSTWVFKCVVFEAD